LLVLFIAVVAIVGIAALGGAVDDLFKSTDEVPWDSGSVGEHDGSAVEGSRAGSRGG
jgi:hypothetical protein